MGIKGAEKLANRIWNRYEKFQQTFSHNLHVYSEENRKIALIAINRCERNEGNRWNPTREQFVAEFINVVMEQKNEKA